MSSWKLKDNHRAFMVEAFACYAMSSEVVRAVKAKFDIDITRQSADYYNPECAVGERRLGTKWKDLHKMVRAAFIEDITATVPFSLKSVRIKELATAAQVFKDRANFIGMARMLEQIAKEVGNVHTNKRELTGKDGGAIKFQDVGDMTDGQLDDEIAVLQNRFNTSDVHPAPTAKQ